MNTQDKPTKLQEILDRIVSQEAITEGGWAEYALNDDDIKYGNPLHNQAELKQAISDLVIGALPEEKKDTKGKTQNPNNPNYLTKSATAYNQCLADIKSNLAQRGFIVGGEDEVQNT